MESMDELGGVNSIEMRGHNYAMVALALLSLIAGIYWWSYVQPVHIVLLIVGYILTSLGVTMGYHRYFMHHSFKCKSWLMYTLLILGTMSATGPLLQWVRTHRAHHFFVEESGDPHSPLTGNKSKWAGLFYAHMGWLLHDFKANKPTLSKEDISLMRMTNNSSMAVLSFSYYAVIVLGLIIPGIIAGLWTQSLNGAAMGVLWGGFLRCVLLLFGSEFSINSFCHMFGQRTFETKDNSRDNWFFGIFSLGEGWHNTHHKFPYSARHGLKWWQIDISYYVIYLLAKCGMVWDVKLPVKQRTKDAHA